MIPEGYELAEVSAAKNHAQDELESELERQGIDPYSERADQPSPGLIGLADAIVERLVKEGVTIPDTLCDLNGEPAQRPRT